LLEEGKVRGAIFESKAGRQACAPRWSWMPRATATCSRARAPAYESDIEAADIHHCMNTAWLLGGVDMDRWIEFKAGSPSSSRSSWRAAARR
jgi:hypothetical protein